MIYTPGLGLLDFACPCLSQSHISHSYISFCRGETDLVCFFFFKEKLSSPKEKKKIQRKNQSFLEGKTPDEKLSFLEEKLRFLEGETDFPGGVLKEFPSLPEV